MTVVPNTVLLYPFNSSTMYSTPGTKYDLD
jgi:hypothetical protein